MYIIGQTVKVLEDKSYYISPEHRNERNRTKSFWIITPDNECECFVCTCSNNWINRTVGWGVYAPNGRIEFLGRSRHGDQLKIAKFVDKNEQKTWHGYPADHVVNIQDRPATLILKEWVDIELIQKKDMLRILQGKRV